MPFRSRTSVQKRQKELLRAEKQREKTAKRLSRKLAAKDGEPQSDQPADQESQPADQESQAEPQE